MKLENLYLEQELKQRKKNKNINNDIQAEPLNLKKIARTLAIFFIQQIPIIFSDYTPTLAPDTYLVSVAISEKNPFLIVDIKSQLHRTIRYYQKKDLRELMDSYQHILKLFVSNLKHYLRQQSCRKDILKVAQKIDDLSILHQPFKWLTNHKNMHDETYLQHLKPYIPIFEH